MTQLPDASGSVIRNLHTSREAKVYPLFESEMTSLGVLNFFSSLSFSAAAFFLSFWCALKLQKEVTKDMSNVTGAGEFMLTTGPTICFVLTIFFTTIGLGLFGKRAYDLKRIKDAAVQRTSDIDNANT